VQAVTASHRRFKSNISLGGLASGIRESENRVSENRVTIDLTSMPRQKSIYNPFALPSVIPERKSMAFNDRDDDEPEFGVRRGTTPSKKGDGIPVSQSVQNWSPSLMLKQSAQDDMRPRPDTFETAADQSNQDLVKEALKKAQAAWIKTTEERQTILGEINLPRTIEEDEQVLFDQVSEEEYEDDIFD
jgi:hypothetical protein